VPFHKNEVFKALSRLSNKKSHGMDCLSGFFIKKFASILVEPLTVLFNRVIKDNEIPPTWKIAKISPVHKKGSLFDVANFRPVSNLPAISKVFELCLLQRLETFDTDALVSPNQHGFRKSHSTDTAVCEVMSLISEGLESGQKVGLYSADLTAAFDLLRKEELVEIMVRKNIPKYLIRSIHNYFSDRTAYVQIGDARSCVYDIKTGCVQGSILGPVLFNIYTSSLSEVVNPHKLISYADDSYVTLQVRNYCVRKLQAVW